MSTIAPRGSRHVGGTAPHISATTGDRGPGLSRRLRSFLALACAVALVACGGGGGGGGDGGDGGQGGPPGVRGRVVLCAIGGATVSMYRVGEYGFPLGTTTSSTGSTAGETGKFSFPMPAGPSDALVLFVRNRVIATAWDGGGPRSCRHGQARAAEPE